MTNDPCASERYSDNGNLSLRGSGASVVTRQVAGVDCRLVSQQRSSSGSSHGSGSGGHSSGYHTEEQVKEESEETSQEGDRHLITSINKVRVHCSVQTLNNQAKNASFNSTHLKYFKIER